MKAISAATLAFALTLIPASTMFSSCQSSAPDAAAKTADHLGILAADLQTASDRIATTLAALTGIQSKADTDPRPEYDKYVKSVGDLKSSAERLKKDGEAVKQHGKEFFTSWEQNIATLSNAEFQKASRDRLEETRANYAKVEERAAETNKKFDSLLSQLNDIKETLGFDLNKAGIASLSGAIESCTKTGKELQKSLAEASAKIADVKQAMSASSPTPPPAESTAK